MYTYMHILSLSTLLTKSRVPQCCRCAANFYKKFFVLPLQLQTGSSLFSVIRIRNTHTHRYIIDSFVQRVLRFVFIRLHLSRASIYMYMHNYIHV
jgi:hypothetical protein